MAWAQSPPPAAGRRQPGWPDEKQGAGPNNEQQDHQPGQRRHAALLREFAGDGRLDGRAGAALLFEPLPLNFVLGFQVTPVANASAKAPAVG